MIKKNFLTLILLLVTFITGLAQSYKHFTWQDAGVVYNALMVYHNPDDIVVRVKYKHAGVGKVAEYKASRFKNPPVAPNDILYFGSKARFISSEDGKFSEIKIPTCLYLKDYDPQANKGTGYYMISTSKIRDQKARNAAPKVKMAQYKDEKALEASGIKLTDYFRPVEIKLMNSGPKASNKAASYDREGQVHVILVGYTNGSILDQSINKEIEQLKTLFGKTIGQNSTSTFNVTTFTGSNCTAAAINRSLDRMGIGRKDAVIFHYIGQGPSALDRDGDFPKMALKNGQYRLQELFSNIRFFRPRLTIVTADLSYSPRSTTPIIKSQNPITRSKIGQIDPAQVNLLLSQARGSLISTSSAYGEYASFLNDGQAAFTESLRYNLEDALSIKTDASMASWDNILAKSYQDAYEKTKNETNATGTKGQKGFHQGNISYD